MVPRILVTIIRGDCIECTTDSNLCKKCTRAHWRIETSVRFISSSLAVVVLVAKGWCEILNVKVIKQWFALKNGVRGIPSSPHGSCDMQSDFNGSFFSVFCAGGTRKCGDYNPCDYIGKWLYRSFFPHKHTVRQKSVQRVVTLILHDCINTWLYWTLIVHVFCVMNSKAKTMHSRL